MERKLIQLSPSTGVISLPSSWIKSNNLKKGDSLSIEEIENDLIISTKSKKTKSEITVDVSKYDRRLMWAVIDNAYISGYDSIKIKTKDAKQSSLMTKVVRYFPGMIIVDERKDFVVFKSISGSDDNFETILKRIFNLLISLLEDSVDFIENKEWDDLSKIKTRDYVINSYVSYALRTINIFGFTPFSKLGAIHTFLKVLELLSDKLCDFFESVAKNKSKQLKSKDINLLVDLLKQVRHLHFKYSTESILKLDLGRQKLLKLADTAPVYAKSFFKDLEDSFYALIELEMQFNS